MRVAMSSSSPLSLPFSSSTIAQTHHRKYSASVLPTAAVPPQFTQQQSCTSSDDSSHIGHNSPPKPKTIRFRLSQLCREGQLHLARQVFDAISQPTIVLWNTLIIGYVCNNVPHEAISLYSRMFRTINSADDRKPDAYTYSSVLKACAETKQLLIGKAVHCHILRSNVYPSRIVYNSLLNMYATCLSSLESDLVKRVFWTMRKRNVVSWNTMISWYAKTCRFMEAFRHLLLMMKSGFGPTVVSFVNVFPAISALEDIEIANMVYGMVIKLGGEYVNDLFVVSSAITMYADLGCLEFARKIFDNCLQKNAHVWNTMIGGYIQNNCPIVALELFNQALEEQDYSNIDDVTFLSALTAASELQQLDVGQQLHSYLIKSSLVSSVILLNAIVALYSRCNSIRDSFKVFSGMQERDVVSWNTIICAFVQNGFDDEGLMLVYEMQKLGFAIDGVTITALLSAASNLRNHKIGKETHAYLIRHGIQFHGVESYLIDMYAKSGLTQDAQRIFDGKCKGNNDLAVWNAMISGSTQNELVEQSLIIFQQMLMENIMPNAVTLASILPACSQLGSIALGKLLHGFAIRNFFDENVFVSSALVDMYSKCGEVVHAERVFLKSAERNSVTYTNMILGYGQHGMGQKAIRLFHSMRELGVNPDAVTIVAVLSACSYSGLINEGLEIFEYMESEYGIKPSTEHYACIVDMLGRVGRVVEAYDFAQKLGKEGNVSGIWGSLLAACKIHRNFELGKVVANKLLDMEGADRITGYHVLLSNIHAEEGNWEHVKNVREEMLERGLMKEVGCSWINISGYANCFVSRDKKHPLCAEIYQLLNHLSANLKDAGYTPPFLSNEC
ncbi:pentatricopeptide repeat-containing protein At3g22150, chloroplastic [Sesamum indicum]|uniref:Pentatricopeptide repeat-containing protein At3g22150, chloroplastic n=1 Tax=Sesamum indicum TaxID=4182 RepID=A0A6I9TSN0_SESIN|nr:pentatricopeptide repeat-containing protein At3g22150, chloroplastic [Sesamum indicum]XP_020551192.1 pentatricopeptide repeat-containing protein At3g22150, chloroplastic [Sesamum indicum]